MTEKQQQWSEHIADWEASGLTQSIFCQQHNLSYATFVYWRSYFKKQGQQQQLPVAVNFLPVNIRQPNRTGLTLMINGLHGIDIQQDFDPVLLADVVRALS